MSSLPSPCGLNGALDLNGYTLDHWTLQTHMCVSNRLVLGFGIANIILSALVCFTMLYFLFLDFKNVGRQWTLSKSFYVATSVTCGGLMIGGFEVFATGRAVLILNSMVWIFGSEGLMVAAFCTLFHWIKFTIQMLDMQDQEYLRAKMVRLRKTLLTPTFIVFCVCLPILFVRAAVFNLQNPLVYNICTLLYYGSMIPWFVNWAICSQQFATEFSRIIEETVKATRGSNMKIAATQNITESKAFSSLAPSTTVNTANNSAKKSGAEMLQVAQRVRWVGIGIVLDKILFIVAYVSIMISSSIGWRLPEMSNIPYGFYAFYLMVIPGANFLIVAMSYYHHRTGTRQMAPARSETQLAEADKAIPAARHAPQPYDMSVSLPCTV
ncbi:hypothetical protein HDU85_001502 [Gaertneriomyces sp. JEL0708]|nr:hypothetical protein HDU85_001502 [Gaertneriomyces sp. JEL0708]